MDEQELQSIFEQRQEIIDKNQFYGNIIDDLTDKVKYYEEELVQEVDNNERKETIKEIIESFKITIKHYKGEQKELAFML